MGEWFIGTTIGDYIGTTIGIHSPIPYEAPDSPFVLWAIDVLPEDVRWQRGIGSPNRITFKALVVTLQPPELVCEWSAKDLRCYQGHSWELDNQGHSYGKTRRPPATRPEKPKRAKFEAEYRRLAPNPF